MARKPKTVKLSFLQWVGQAHWAVKYLTPFLLFFSATGAAYSQWDRFGFWKPASVRYVDDKTAPIRDLQIETAEGKRDAARNKAYEWQDKMESTTDQEKKVLYRDRMREQIDSQHRLDDQIRTLRRIRDQ